MPGSVFIAGAAGAIGWPLCKLLLGDGWTVSGTTRSSDRAERLRAIGVVPFMVDIFDAEAVTAAVVAARPDLVIHQLTDLPAGLDPTQMAEGRKRNARIREEGTRNLVAAALAAGVSRIVAQSIAFAYAPGPQPFAEDAPLDPAQTAVASLEQQVLEAPVAGVVLRYGKLYGPGTGFHSAGPGAVHVDAAADAARRAAKAGTGIYNIAEDDGAVSIRRARVDLGWEPDFRA